MARADAPDGASLVLGTAGHIDHGKTTLVRALTGVDTDRLPEEKARGITIDLGFAALDLPDGPRVSVVDVPGHEKLVRTMVSGATGIDLVLLVVAADEGVMPQTREHIAICKLLGIERGVVALTKSDLVDEETCELAGEEVRELLEGTGLESAAVVAVSGKSGDGLTELQNALAEAVRSSHAHTPRGGPPRLWIDRTFAIRGFGSVVTGTLVGSPLSVGQTVEVAPTGRSARIRGLQSHGESRDSVRPGSRCAVNLQGVDVAQLARGHLVVPEGTVPPTQTFDVQLDWLASTPAVRGDAAVELLVGTAERRARLAPIGAEGFLPGTSGFARVHLEGDALPLLPGDRFIARGFARLEGWGATVGGGVVLDVAPPHRRRSDPALARELSIFASGDMEGAVRERVVRTGLSGAEAETLARELGAGREELDEILRALEQRGELVLAAGSLWIARESLERMERELLASLDAYHSAEPLRPGMPRGSLRGQLPSNVRPEIAELVLARLEHSGAVTAYGDLVWRADFTPTFTDEAREALESIRGRARDSGLEPPSQRDWCDSLGIDTDLFRDLVAHLEREGALVRAPGDVWFDTGVIDSLRARLVAHLEEHGEIDTAAYKALTGTSRRTTVPLMELFDELHVTRRVGDKRILRKG